MASETVECTPRNFSDAPLAARKRLVAMLAVIGVYLALLGVMSLVSYLART